jgi:hypothetical protein
MAIEKKYFPIKTATACQLKWSWSSLNLARGETASCHRTSITELSEENFFNFHNTPLKMADRQSMIDGVWPKESCAYCRVIEENNGFSDRQRQLLIEDIYPEELDIDPKSTHIQPVLIEVYFNNTCNLGCLYCDVSGAVSSMIANENMQFGNFKKDKVELITFRNHSKNLTPYFWQWFPEGFPKIKRLNILGGEPLYQKELDQLLDMIEKYPNPNCELNISTNIMSSKKRIENFLARTKDLLISRKIKRLDMTVSIDCWGPEQEYVRWGIDLKKWEENFNLLMQNKWIYLNINQTISALTVKTMPELLTKLNEWRKQRKIGHWFGGVAPGPSYLKNGIFDESEFADDVNVILSMMPTDSEEHRAAYEYMKGILKNTKHDSEEIKNLIIFLNEKDRRRNTNWRELFPWLIKYEDLCGIQE